MKESLLSRVAPNAKEMIKEAILGSIGRLALKGAGRAGKVLVKNPMMSATAATAGLDMGASVKKMNDLSSGASNMMKSRMTTPANL